MMTAYPQSHQPECAVDDLPALAPTTAAVILRHVPSELRRLPQWLVWKYESRGGDKPTKLPYQIDGRLAKTNDPTTWTEFDEAYAAHASQSAKWAGMGFVFKPGGGLVGIDFDDCIDRETGEIDARVADLIAAFDSYTEVSPSGCGVKIWCHGDELPKGVNAGWSEMYSSGRFFAFTGQHWPGAPLTVNDAHEAIKTHYARLTLKPEQERPRTPGVHSLDAAVKRARAYIARMPSAISGAGGHDRTFAVACELFRFGLFEADAWALLNEYSQRCQPPWGEKELRHKLGSAQRQVEQSGQLGSRLRAHSNWNGKGRHHPHHPQRPEPQSAGLTLDPDNPMEIARTYRAIYQHEGRPTLFHSADEYLQWDQTRYVPLNPLAVTSAINLWLDGAQKIVRRGENEITEPFRPTTRHVSEVHSALRSLCYRPLTMPAWLVEDPGLPDPMEVLATSNALVHLRKDGPPTMISEPTPLWFSRNAVDYAYNADAPEPTEWLKFLDTLWPNDPRSQETLQEWFGYSLTLVTRMQKALMIVGPKRSGKGTIARILAKVIGITNVCAPTLAGLATNFGLWPLIGKQLGIVGDARLSGRTDQAVVIERLLSITGEDALTIDRKNLEPLTLRLLTRLMLLTNELPKLSDASGSLANRFVVLVLTQSFFGREDHGLEDRLTTELPGILNWSIQGWQRLWSRGRFVQPNAGQTAIDEMEELASPISAFLADWCVIAPGRTIAASELFTAWQAWRQEQGYESSGAVQTFGRDLRAAQSGIVMKNIRTANGRERTYEGISLTLLGSESARKWNAVRDGTRSS